MELTASDDNGRRRIVRLRGAWVVDEAASLSRDRDRVVAERARTYCFDLAGLRSLDTTGAWLLASLCRDLEAAGSEITVEGVHPRHRALLEHVRAKAGTAEPSVDGETTAPAVPGQAALASFGRRTVRAGHEFVGVIGFLGLLALCLARLVSGREAFPKAPLVHHMQRVWLDALPIVGLLSFLIGVVLAWQGVIQLSRFGAETLATNLAGLAVVREVGILLPAVIVAGRSGSAFTAEIGTMKVSQEVDAMLAIGIDPLAVLVIPRMLALMLTFPLLAVYSDLAGLAGGGVMAWLAADISPVAFVSRLEGTIGLNDFLVGIVKAPIFGTIVALVGCYQGLQVSASAKQVGERTTRSVVQSIFLVLVTGSLLSVLFGLLGY